MKPSTIVTFLSACAILLLAGGCAVGPSYQKPETVLPETATEAENLPAPEDWWSRFADDHLNQLLEATMTGNHTLDAGRQNIVKARALLASVQGSNLPQIGLNASAIRQERSENSLFPVLENTPGFPDRTVNLFHGSFDASWEMDIFGANRNLIQAGKLQVTGAELALRDLQASLLAETGRLYILYLTLGERIAFLKDNIAARQQILDVVNARYKAGTVSELDPAQAKSALHQLEAQLPGLQAEREALLAGLSTLTAIPVTGLRESLAGLNRIPPVEAYFGDTIDSSILQHRPDIRLAETRIQQANAELGAHIANLYPRFTLVGSLGLESIDADTFTESASRLWRLGPSITLPILEGGRLRNQVKAAEAELDKSVAEYKQVVLQSLGEAESNLIRFNKGIEEMKLASLASESAFTAYQTALKQYQAGVLPMDRMLTLHTEHLAARDRLVQVRGKSALLLIALSKSLGGSLEFSR